MNVVRRWLTGPARTPRWLRAGIALVLTTTALFGIFEPPASPAVSGSAADGGPPSGAGANAAWKRPYGPGAGNPTTAFPNSPALRVQGQTLYANGCASCHGLDLRGRYANGPSLYGVGAGPIDFYVSTGRMPLQNPKDEPERAHPAYDPQQIDALIAYITATAGGPPASAVQVSRGDLSQGFSQFTLHCAGCHQLVGRGGIVIGAYVPNLQDATPLEIGEAVRMGPYLMPHFDAAQIDQQQLNSIARYIVQTRHPDNAGGWGIDNIGPIPEGLAAWFIALLAMVMVARLIGERTGGGSR